MAQVAVTKSEFQSIVSQSLEKDERDCKALVEAYEKASTYAVKNMLVREHALEFDPNFFRQVTQGLTDLEIVDRPILVIGETSAGKSSFLNLLIGRKVLPELTAPCTHCMCCIKTGPTLEAHVSSGDHSTPSEVQIISGNAMTDDEFRAKLKVLVNEENCAQATRRRIDIFVQSRILEDNVYLVDTPGFGEKEQITQSLVRFLPKAIGIIFILNPTVNLGIADDRGAVILDEIKRLTKEGEIPSFDPSKVIFIANKWDQVEKEEKKDHREQIIKRMQTLWPHFQEDQLLTLSVKHVRKAGDNQKGNTDKYKSAMMDYQNVLDKIRAIVQHCADARSNVHTRYLDKFLKHLETCLHVGESFSMLSTNDKHIKATILQTLVADLESTYQQGERTISALDTVQLEIAKDVHQYLNNAENRERIFTWKMINIPNGSNYPIVKQQARVAIRKFIANAIVTFIEKGNSTAEKMIDQLSKLVEEITKKGAKMEHFLENIESDNAFEQETANGLPSKGDDDIDLSKKEIAAILLTSPLWVPLGVAGMVTVVPVTVAVQLTRRTFKIAMYRANIENHLERWTQKILKEEYTLEILKYITFDKLFGKIHEKMMNFSKSIANYKNILTHIDREKQTEAVVRGYAEMRDLCHQLHYILPKSQKR